MHDIHKHTGAHIEGHKQVTARLIGMAFFGHRCSLHHSAQQMEGVGGTRSENVVVLEVSQVYHRHL